MKKASVLIDEVIKEHKSILEKVNRLDQMVGDAEAMSGLDEALDTFVPGRFNQTEKLVELTGLIDSLDTGLKGHFDREESAVLGAFVENGDTELVTSFRSLMQEHTELRNRLAATKDSLSKLSSGELSAHHWQATAHDLRAYIAHTRKLLQAHASAEQELLLALSRRLATTD